MEVTRAKGQKKSPLFGIYGGVIVGKLFLFRKYKSLPLPSFILAKNILTSRIMFN
jgi:hypothetical protein